jgi:hypothetical protein
VVAEREPFLLHPNARAWVHGEEDALVELIHALHDPPQARLFHVRLAVDRGDDVGPRLVRNRKRGTCDRAEEPVGVGHHVTDDVDSAEDTLALEDCARAVIGTEQEPGEAVRLDPVVLLRHGEVAAPETCFDVRQRNRRVCCRARACDRRVRVAVDEDEVGRLCAHPLGDGRLHDAGIRGVELEPIARLGEAELVEEDLRERVVPVLPCVEHDLVDARILEGGRERRGFDELGAVPDDGEDLHGRARLLAAVGRSCLPSELIARFSRPAIPVSSGV